MVSFLRKQESSSLYIVSCFRSKGVWTPAFAGVTLNGYFITLLKYLLPIYPCGLNHQFPFILKQHEIGWISRNDPSPHIWK